MGTAPADPGRRGVRKRTGAEIHQQHDVRREAVDGADDFLQRDEAGGREGERRRVQAVQEGGGELQAGAGSEDATRGRRELPGAGGSESLPEAVAGDSLAGAVRAGAFGKEHDAEAGGRDSGCGGRTRGGGGEEGGRG